MRQNSTTSDTSQIILGGGCFWCIEAPFQRLAGVQQVTSGYAGGHTESPNYKSVCSDSTGHAEVVLVEWDNKLCDLPSILNVFFSIHDPTSLNRQGNDRGTQYRSFIGYQNDSQLEEIEAFIKHWQQDLDKPIVTELQHWPKFYPAEEEHRDYYNKHHQQMYCQIMIKPKIDKLMSLPVETKS